MIRLVLAAVAAFALTSAAPALAGCPDCKDCPMHKAAAADTAEKKDKADPAVAVPCPCAGEGKECKCGEKCQCPHCAAKKAAEKDQQKKT
jgi:hypothetical protein